MSAQANGLERIGTIVSCANAVMSRIPDGLLQLLARVAIAPTFFRSGQAKINGFSVNDSTVFLFEHEFGMPFPVLSAHLAALAENILPVLLVVGFATRLSALALFVMTIVIQIVTPQGFWTFRILWFAVLLYVVAKGPGQVSVDHLIDRAYRNRTA